MKSFTWYILWPSSGVYIAFVFKNNLSFITFPSFKHHKTRILLDCVFLVDKFMNANCFFPWWTFHHCLLSIILKEILLFFSFLFMLRYSAFRKFAWKNNGRTFGYFSFLNFQTTKKEIRIQKTNTCRFIVWVQPPFWLEGKNSFLSTVLSQTPK